MSTYGLSTEQIADVLERDGRTILEWQQALGQKCQSFHLTLCTVIGLTLMSLQMDEIWSYLQKKKRHDSRVPLRLTATRGRSSIMVVHHLGSSNQVLGQL